MVRAMYLSLLLLLPSAHAATYFASAGGDDGGLDLSEALGMAEPGDTVHLEDGVYDVQLATTRDGEQDSPIIVEGGPGAIINGDSSPSVLVTHSFITLKGFTVDGQIGPSSSEDSYVAKCVLAQGSGTNSSSLDGFVMESLNVQNCGGECVRLRYSVVGANITGNTIQDCGIHDYRFNSTEKNGEGIYIGTASSQWVDGPDETNDNFVLANNISTNGNECVDIKEGATGNLVEGNICTNQLDEDSGCYDSRGDGNTFRYNVGWNCLGVGVRLGGWEVDGHQYGVSNSVYGNIFAEVACGAMKVTVGEQGEICGNQCEDGSDCALSGDGISGITETWNEACTDVGGPSSTSYYAAPNAFGTEPISAETSTHSSDADDDDNVVASGDDDAGAGASDEEDDQVLADDAGSDDHASTDDDDDDEGDDDVSAPADDDEDDHGDASDTTGGTDSDDDDHAVDGGDDSGEATDDADADDDDRVLGGDADDDRDDDGSRRRRLLRGVDGGKGRVW